MRSARSSGRTRRGRLAHRPRGRPGTGTRLCRGNRRAVRFGRHPGQQRGDQPVLRADHRARPGAGGEDGRGQPARLPRLGAVRLGCRHVHPRRCHPQHGLGRRTLGRIGHRLVQRDQGRGHPPDRAAGRRARPGREGQRPRAGTGHHRLRPRPLGTSRRRNRPKAPAAAPRRARGRGELPRSSSARTRRRG